MIRVYKNEGEFFIKSKDLNSYLETQEAFNLLHLRDFCEPSELNIYLANFSNSLFYKLDYVLQGCKVKSKKCHHRLAEWKQERIKQLANYLEAFTTTNNKNNYICINE